MMRLRATSNGNTIYAPATQAGARSLFALGATELHMEHAPEQTAPHRDSKPHPGDPA